MSRLDWLLVALISEVLLIALLIVVRLPTIIGWFS